MAVLSGTFGTAGVLVGVIARAVVAPLRFCLVSVWFRASFRPSKLVWSKNQLPDLDDANNYEDNRNPNQHFGV